MNKLSLKYLIEDTLKELKVFGDLKNAKYLIAFQDRVWLFPTEEVPEEVAKEISKLARIEPRTNIDDFREEAENNIGLVVGSLSNEDKILYIWGYGGLGFDPKTSLVLKKIVNQLKLKGVERAVGDNTQIIKKSKMKGDLPKTVFHGTSAKYLDKILRFGLQPAKSPTNYPNIITHEDLIFFTSREEDAAYHAAHTANRTSQKNSRNLPSFSRSPTTHIPIFLELEIPDKDKVVPDYDVAAMSVTSPVTGLRGGLSSDRYIDLQKEKGPRQLSRETGIWGYKGRIPAKFIKYVYVPKNWPEIAGSDKVDYLEVSDYKKFKPQSALRYIEKLEEYGY